MSADSLGQTPKGAVESTVNAWQAALRPFRLNAILMYFNAGNLTHDELDAALCDIFKEDPSLFKEALPDRAPLTFERYCSLQRTPEWDPFRQSMTIDTASGSKELPIDSSIFSSGAWQGYGFFYSNWLSRLTLQPRPLKKTLQLAFGECGLSASENNDFGGSECLFDRKMVRDSPVFFQFALDYGNVSPEYANSLFMTIGMDYSLIDLKTGIGATQSPESDTALARLKNLCVLMDRKLAGKNVAADDVDWVGYALCRTSVNASIEVSNLALNALSRLQSEFGFLLNGSENSEHKWQCPLIEAIASGNIHIACGLVDLGVDTSELHLARGLRLFNQSIPGSSKARFSGCADLQSLVTAAGGSEFGRQWWSKVNYAIMDQIIKKGSSAPIDSQQRLNDPSIQRRLRPSV